MNTRASCYEIPSVQIGLLWWRAWRGDSMGADGLRVPKGRVGPAESPSDAPRPSIVEAKP